MFIPTPVRPAASIFPPFYSLTIPGSACGLAARAASPPTVPRRRLRNDYLIVQFSWLHEPDHGNSCVYQSHPGFASAPHPCIPTTKPPLPIC